VSVVKAPIFIEIASRLCPNSIKQSLATDGAPVRTLRRSCRSWIDFFVRTWSPRASFKSRALALVARIRFIQSPAMAACHFGNAEFIFRPSRTSNRGIEALPLVLTCEKIGIYGMVAADISLARTWYEKAKEFGSQEASRRLRRLADRVR